MLYSSSISRENRPFFIRLVVVPFSDGQIVMATRIVYTYLSTSNLFRDVANYFNLIMLVDVASVGKYCDIFHNHLVNLDVISNFIGAHLPAYTGYRAQGQAGAGARPRPKASTIYIFSQSWLTYAFRSLIFLPVARNLSVMASLSAAVKA